MHKATAHHPLTDAQPVLEQWWLPQSTPLSFIAFFFPHMMSRAMEYPFGWLRSAPLLAEQ